MRLTTVCLLSTLAFLTQALLPREVVPQSDQQKDLRTLTVTVTDKNHAPINKLEAASFSVTVDKVAHEVVEASQTDSPLSVVIVFDFSGSMGAKQRRASKRTRQALDAVKSFVELSHPANEYFVVGFNDRAFTLSNAFQSAGATMGQLNAMSNGEFEGSTALYDAVHLAINTLGLGTNAKRVILLLSDGQDNKSHATFKETINVLGKRTRWFIPSISAPMNRLVPRLVKKAGPYSKTLHLFQAEDLCNQK